MPGVALTSLLAGERGDLLRGTRGPFYIGTFLHRLWPKLGGVLWQNNYLILMGSLADLRGQSH